MMPPSLATRVREPHARGVLERPSAGADDHLTILIPTFNRSRYLARVLRYLQALGTSSKILVLDSSTHAASREQQTLQGLPGLQQVRYAPDIHPLDKICDGLARVSSPYVVLWSDDDFLVPRSLEAAVRFLEAHPEYSCAHGEAALFSVEANGLSPRVVCQSYYQRSITAVTAAERLRNHLTRYSVMSYSVRRTEQLKTNLHCCQAHGLGYAWDEITLGCLSVIQGKVKQLDSLYLLKEMHAGADSWNTTGKPIDVFDRVTAPTFPARYQAFRECVAQALIEADGVSPAQAPAVVKEAFWSYVAQALTSKWQARYGPRLVTVKDRLRDVAGSLPGLRGAWSVARSVLPRLNRRLSVEALLHPSSPYHADFLPIYQAILAMPEGDFSPSAVAQTQETERLDEAGAEPAMTTEGARGEPRR